MLHLDSVQPLENLLYYDHHLRPESEGSRLEKGLSKTTLQAELCGELPPKGLALGTTAAHTHTGPNLDPWASPPPSGCPSLALEEEAQIQLAWEPAAERRPFNIAREAAEINGKLEFYWGPRDQPASLP